MHALLTTLALCLLLAVAAAITCYDCESLSDPRCNQYFEPEGVRQIDCNDADLPQYLHKYERRVPATGCITKVHEGIEGRRYYIRRSCYFGDLENTEEACEAPDPYVPFVDLISCSVCAEDLCNTNASGRRTAPAWTMLGGFIVGWLFLSLK